MKTRLLLSLLAVSGAAHAQNAPAPQIPVQSAPESAPFFRDVPRDHWAFAAVQKLAGAGILEGVGNEAAPQKMTVLPAPRAATNGNAALKVPSTRAALGANPALKSARINVVGLGQNSLILRGTVKSEAQKQLASAIARKNAPGFNISDQLRVTR